MQPILSSTFCRAMLEQPGAAAEDNVAPGSVKIHDPLCTQAPGARCLSTVRAKTLSTMKNARTALKQPGRQVVRATYQPR